MQSSLSRYAAGSPWRVLPTRYFAICALALAFLPYDARAIIVRGHATDALGQPVSGAKVQIIQGTQVVASAYSDANGFFEARAGNSGRFKMLGTAARFLPALGEEFYGGALDIVQKDVVLSANSVQQEVSVAATDIPTPIPELTAPVSVVPGSDLATRLGVVSELRQTPGVFFVQTGQTGSLTSLFLRGGNSTANLVLVDGIPAEDVGGTFDFGTVSSTGIGRLEVYRGPDSGIYGTDAGAGVVTINTPRGTTSKPVLNYSGDGGNLHEWRNEVTVGGTHRKLDYFAGISRLDASNALQLDRYHSVTSVANAGYAIDGETELRFTIRNGDSVEGLPGPHDFYGISQDGREGDQDLYSGATLEHHFADNWHALVRYGIARKREQAQYFTDVGTLETFYPNTPDTFTEYYGNPVTIRGANGYSATGEAAFLDMAGDHSDQASNRDQLYFQADWSPSRHFNGLFGFRYDNERGVFNELTYFDGFADTPSHETTQRTNFEYNLQFQGEYFGRLNYSLGGSLEKNHLYGIAGTPRLGLAYSPVRPGTGLFHGTRLRGNVATGVQEPTLALEYFSLYDQLLQNGLAADIPLYHIGPPSAERSRTYDIGVDQDIFGEKLILKVNYFHNVFDRQLEAVSGPALQQYFNINIPALLYNTQYVNSLAFRAQGEEVELDWQALRRLYVRGGYTHLDSRVLQSFASDAVAANQGVPNENPNLPGIPIGLESPLVGARPFRRAPNTGFFKVTYVQSKWTAAFQGALASRSDDSTFLDGFDLNFGNSLVLPNHDLDFGYAKLDLSGTYTVMPKVTLFTQLDNLLNDQHVGPIGYPGLPFTVRGGVKVRLGGSE